MQYCLLRLEGITEGTLCGCHFGGLGLWWAKNTPVVCTWASIVWTPHDSWLATRYKPWVLQLGPQLNNVEQDFSASKAAGVPWQVGNNRFFL